MTYFYRYARFSFFIIAILLTLYGLLFFKATILHISLTTIATLLTLLGIIDISQKTYVVRRNYPIVGNLRYLLNYFRPEIRQYFIEGDNEQAPFSRHQRNLVHARSRLRWMKDSVIGFGSIEDFYKIGFQNLTHSINPLPPIDPETLRITIGGEQCSKPYSSSIFNISAMSFGALSGRAVESLNWGAKLGNFYHDTGEGGISKYHREHGGDLVWEIGSGYFGCRTETGHFNPESFQKQAITDQVKMIEIKLSQGAKPGQGGVVPASKVTEEIAQARHVPVGEDCVSPASHSAFTTPIELLEFVKLLRDLSGGKPTGFKLCIGHPWEFMAIAKAMLETNILPDFIVIDGKEGGTGSSPIEFANHIGMTLQEGLLFAHNVLVGTNLRHKIKIGAAGKIISAFDIIRILALGADWANSARGFMFSLGCIQARACHTNHCPTGITTQDPIRQKVLNVENRRYRVFNYHRNTMKAFAEILSAAGIAHPKDLQPHHLVYRTSKDEVRLLSNTFYYLKKGALLDGSEDSSYYSDIWKIAQAHTFKPNKKALLRATSTTYNHNERSFFH